MQYVFRNKQAYIQTIEFQNTLPILNIEKIRSFREEGVVGKFLKKQFQYSTDGVVWSRWETLNQKNLLDINDTPFFDDHTNFYIKFRYTRARVIDGNINEVTLIYDSRQPTPSQVPDSSLINADLLQNEEGNFYLDLKQHHGALASDALTVGGVGSGIDVFDAITTSPSDFHINLRRIRGEGDVSVYLDGDSIVVSVDDVALRSYVDASLDDIRTHYIPEASLNQAYFHWDGGLLEPSIATGIPGPAGPVGPQGDPGPAGAQGTTGAQGKTGAGAQGRTGAQGIRGPKGDPGPDGAQGTQGEPGPIGPIGKRGPAGDRGAQGTTGTQGLQGIQGRDGRAGTRGLSGLDGAQGIQGMQGIQGVQGKEGRAGTRGFSGLDGEQGIQGTQGTQGLIGVQGTTGCTGAQGTTGSQGLDGIQGLQGTDGRIGLRGPMGDDGPQGIQGIQGPQGPIGIQGIEGRKGSGGIQGTQGVQGEGIQGATGAQGTTGCKGEPGEAAAQGLPGAQGRTGTQGPVGAQGRTGAQGIIGVQGYTGVQGLQGIQGFQGITGAQGLEGIQGRTGTQGLQGAQGIQGRQGIQGLQGLQGIQGRLGVQGLQGVQGPVNDASINELYEWQLIQDISIGLMGTGAYESMFPLSEIVPEKLGGISEGTTVQELNGKTFSEMFDQLLFPAQNPQLIAPTNTFTMSPGTTLYEVGTLIPTLTFTAGFNRGSITPPYGTNGYRSGLPNKYNYIGNGLPGSVISTLFSDIQIINNHIVNEGTTLQSWKSSVSYDGGEQPKNSKGENYNSALPPGTTSQITRTIEGSYPFYATINDVYNVEPLQLRSLATNPYPNSDPGLELAGEPDEINKQKIDVPSVKVVTGIRTKDPIMGWVYEGTGNGLDDWATSTVFHQIQGQMIPYTRYTYNTIKRGKAIIRLEF